MLQGELSSERHFEPIFQKQEDTDKYLNYSDGIMCNSRKLSSDKKVPSGSVFLNCSTMKFLNASIATVIIY